MIPKESGRLRPLFVTSLSLLSKPAHTQSSPPENHWRTRSAALYGRFPLGKSSVVCRVLLDSVLWWAHHRFLNNRFADRRKKNGLCSSKEESARRRCQFGPEGYDRLVAQFESNPFPDVGTRARLATQLGATEKQVTTW